jgi:hypothetical protein
MRIRSVEAVPVNYPEPNGSNASRRFGYDHVRTRSGPRSSEVVDCSRRDNVLSL